MSTPNVSRRLRAAVKALQAPDRFEDYLDPDDVDNDAPVDDPIHMRYRHENIGVGPDGTWAFFRLGATGHYGWTRDRIDADVNARAHRWENLQRVGVSWVWETGIPNPMPVEAYLASTTANAPNRILTPEQWRDRQARVGACLDLHAPTRPLVFWGVRIHARPLEREHLPHLLRGVRAPDHLGVVEDARNTLASVTSIIAGRGLEGAPATVAEMDTMLHASIGFCLPQVSDEERGPVFSTADYFADRVDLHRADRSGTVHASTRVLRVETNAETRDTVGTYPLLGRLTTIPITYVGADGRTSAPVHLQWTALTRIKTPKEAKRDLQRREGINQSIARGETRGRLHLKRLLSQTEKSVDETSHSDRAKALRAEQVILLAVSVPANDPRERATGGQLKAATEAVVTAIEADQGVSLVRRAGQRSDLKKFQPCHDWGPTLREVGDVLPQTGYALAANNAGMSFEAGDTTGFPLGPMRGSRDFAVMDMWGGVRRNRPNLVAMLGEQGSGKTSLAIAQTQMAVEDGHRVTLVSADKQIERMRGIPTIEAETSVVRLARGSTPGILAPGFLIPERARDLSITPEEHDLLVQDDEAQRLDLSVQMVLLTLEWGLRGHPETSQLVKNAIGPIARQYGTHPRELIDAIRAEGSSHAKAVAAALDHGEPMVWTRKPVDEGTFRELNQRLLTIVTTPDVTPPRAGSAPSQWTPQEARSNLIHTGAQWLGARHIQADTDPKMFVSDENNSSAVEGSIYAAFVNRLFTNTRKYYLYALFAYHNVAMMRALGEHILDMFGSAFVFHVDGDNARDALPLLKLPPGVGWEEKISSQLPGEAFWRDWDATGNVRQVPITRLWWDAHTMRVADSTPAPLLPALATADGLRW